MPGVLIYSVLEVLWGQRKARRGASFTWTVALAAEGPAGRAV